MKDQLHAIVIGAGPSGLAAACALALEKWQVTVIEKRESCPPGQGRQNMVATRPEALHQLNELGAFNALQPKLTRITKAITRNFVEGSTFIWPLEEQGRFPATTEDSSYKSPAKIDDQAPSSLVALGDVEDALRQVAADHGVNFEYGLPATVAKSSKSLNHYIVVTKGTDSQGDSDPATIRDADLVVVASGKAGGLSLERELGFQRRIGVSLEESIMPEQEQRDLRLGPEHELESQKFCVFGLRDRHDMGEVDHIVRGNGSPDQAEPLVEITMASERASQMILQLPRSFDVSDQEAIDAYVVERVNERLNNAFTSSKQMIEDRLLIWGDFKPVTVETATAPSYAMGDNLILVGDAAMSCSPSSGLGADIGMAYDVQAVRKLAHELQQIAQSDADNDAHSTSTAAQRRETAFREFNRWKAQGAIYWSRGSRLFYLTSSEAEKFAICADGSHSRN